MAQKREDAVSKEVTRKLSEADNRKMSRKEKDERYVCLSSQTCSNNTVVLIGHVCLIIFKYLIGNDKSLSQDPLEKE